MTNLNSPLYFNVDAYIMHMVMLDLPYFLMCTLGYVIHLTRKAIELVGLVKLCLAYFFGGFCYGGFMYEV